MSDEGAKAGELSKPDLTIDEIKEAASEVGELLDRGKFARSPANRPPGGTGVHMTVDPTDPTELGPAVYTPGDPDAGRTDADFDTAPQQEPTSSVEGLERERVSQVPAADRAGGDPLEQAIRESGKWKDPDFSGASDLVDRGVQYRTTGGSGNATLPVDTTEEIKVPADGPPVDPVFDAETAAEIEKEEMRDTPFSDLTGGEDAAREMGGVPLGDTDESNTAEDALGAPASAAEPVARQAHEPHGITKTAEAAAGTGTSRSPAESLPEGRVPPAASPASSASSRQRETAKGDGMSDSPMSDREAAMAKRNAEINARVKAGAPVKPWNPVFIAKRAKSMSKKARQIAAAAGLAAVLAGLGICASAATRPQVDPAQAAKPAPAPTALIDLQRGLLPQAPTPRPTATPAPVGATVTVTVAYTFAGANCPADLRSREHRLGTEAVFNPAPGFSELTNFGSMTFPKFCTPTLVVEGARQSALAPNLIFRPRTTFEVKERKDDDCLNPSTRVCTIRVDLFVTNESPESP